ncbi:acetyl-CoA carboxylase biotin carboxyl carrier protein [Staphylococcus schleiferi]|uniref:acetyl-CoA carboxylase biotin carboxyl carrier protein n=1 Tax=Staphylococcus schleiferi TaxID=1295 RepID=UPI00248043DC|nr:biotin/lipoyl-containing protein [Staphylococcus schleiferi]
MDLKQIEQTLNLLNHYGAKHFKYKDDDIELELDLFKNTNGQSSEQFDASPSPVPQNTNENAQKQEENESKAIRSQMIGTFYLQDEKELTKPVIKVGDKVNKGDIIGYIEAMKVMNEVTADESGEIQEILIGHGENVEFNQVIVTLK